MKLAVICSIKDEAPYIIDWVAYYRALGFERIVIFQNNSVDGSDHLCTALKDAGYIHYIDNSNAEGAPWHYKKAPPFRRAYGRALRLDCVQTADYIFPVDIDEYLELPKDENFPAMLTRLNYPDVVSFAWRVFGSSGLKQFKPAPVAERFTQAAEPSDQGTTRSFHQMKSVYPPKSTRFYNLHRPNIKKTATTRWVSPNGQDILEAACTSNTLADFDYSYANLRHYHVKSLSEFKLKLVRGTADRPYSENVRWTMSMFDAMDTNTVHLPFENETYRYSRQIADEIRHHATIQTIEKECLGRFMRLLSLAETAINKADIFQAKTPLVKGGFVSYFQREVYDKL